MYFYGVLCLQMSVVRRLECAHQIIKSHLHFTGAESRQRLAAFLEFKGNPKVEPELGPSICH